MKKKTNQNKEFCIEELRTSNYNIIVPIKNSLEYDMIVHGYTGAIDLVSKDVAKDLSTKDLANIDVETLINLHERGY